MPNEMTDDRTKLKLIFNDRLRTICFDDYIENRLAGDFIHNLMPLLAKNEETCGYRIERRYSNESGHIWLEVLSDCGEDLEFENDAYKFFYFCPYCGRKMMSQKQP